MATEISLEDVETQSFLYSRTTATDVASLGVRYDIVAQRVRECQALHEDTARLLQDISAAVQGLQEGLSFSAAAEDHMSTLSSEFVASMKTAMAMEADLAALRRVSEFAAASAQQPGQDAKLVLESPAVATLHERFGTFSTQTREDQSGRFNQQQQDKFVRLRNVIASGSARSARQLNFQDVEHLINDDEEGDDFIVSRTVHSYKCPLTGEYLEDAMRSACGHHFSKTAVFNYAATVGRSPAPCPVTGCSGTFTTQQLVPDAEIMFRVTAAKDRERFQSESMRSNATFVS